MIIGLTIYKVFDGKDIEVVFEQISSADPFWIMVCILMVLLFIYCESWIIRKLFARLDIRIGKGEGFLYSCIGFFFCCVTPSASGGQPAQMVYMKKRGIKISTSTNVLMWVTVLYKMVLVVIGLGLVMFRLDFIRQHMGQTIWIFYLGIFLNIACVFIMVLLWFKSEWLEAMGSSGIALLRRFKLIKRRDRKRKKLRRFIKSYDEAFLSLKGDTKVIIKSFIVTLIQRLALFSITGFVYLSFGMEKFSFFDVMILQSVISIAVDMLPLPGGSGMSEHLFAVVFAGIFKSSLLIPAMVLSRGIAYYVQLIFCGLMTVISHFYFTARQKKEELL
ncbi:MAG: flippase-like domain-containing protein [Lachnospiraceae bacterium]|nr:flippase-like domain-containing protein [Lachnospiraceae bacterium]